MIEDRACITFISNAGILLDLGGTRLLADGLYSSPPEGFSKPPAEVLSCLMQGSTPFENIKYLLFTHTHSDHYSKELTAGFVENNKVRAVIMPEAASLKKSIERPVSTELLELSGAENSVKADISGEITITAVPVRHLDKKYSDVRHYCYDISFRDRRILITSDADYVGEDFSAVQGRHYSAVFLNPLFFGALSRNRFFKGAFDTEKICVYHLPFPEDDIFGINRSTERNLKYWENRQEEVILLNQPLQKIYI